MKNEKKAIFYIVPIVLALVLALTLVGAARQRQVIRQQENILRLNSAFYYVRDVYLKDGDRSGNYGMLQQLKEGIRSVEGEKQQALRDLILTVGEVPPDSPYLDELSRRLDALFVFTDARGEHCEVSVDVEAVQSLTAEVKAHLA